MKSRRAIMVWLLLGLAWVIVLAWQGSEHRRIHSLARQGLVNRSEDISTSLSVVIRSQGRFGLVPQRRLEHALTELTESEELLGVSLLNAAGEITASAGSTPSLTVDQFQQAQAYWDREQVTFVNLVALGANAAANIPAEPTPMVVPDSEGFPSPQKGPPGMGRGPGRRFGGDGPPPEFIAHLFDFLFREENRNFLEQVFSGEPLQAEHVDQFIAMIPKELLSREKEAQLRQALLGQVFDREKLREIGALLHKGPRYGPGPPGGHPFGRMHRPPWLNEADFERLTEKQGIHWFVITMSTGAYHAEIMRDLQLRLIVCGVGLLAFLAIGFAWRALEQSAQLQLDLVRASELNEHLRDMNVAAAGLAHETRNPLNIVRGLAQLIGQNDATPSEEKTRAANIAEEVDRVTNRLNQFMQYSKQPEIYPSNVALKPLADQIVQSLESDLGEKNLSATVTGPNLIVHVDANLLRQVVFNLVLNAIQVVEDGGHIEIVLSQTKGHTAALTVKDNGPGIAPEEQEDIFRPYYTKTENGTGLGLAVVRQIAIAHNWNVVCDSIPGCGATFRVKGIVLQQEENDA